MRDHFRGALNIPVLQLRPSSASAMKKDTFDFLLKCPSDKLLSLYINYNDCVLTKTIFDKVEEVTSIPVEEQLLLTGGQHLRPDVALKDYHLNQGCYIHLSVKGRGGAGEMESGT